MARHEMKIGYGIDGFACIDKFLPHFADFHIFTSIYSMRYLLLSLQEGMIRFM